MVEDLLTVLLCELGERILAMRALLTDPAVVAKKHARAVASLLVQGLDAIEVRLAHEVLRREGETIFSFAQREPADALRVISECARAFAVLHRRLDMLDIRWSAAPVDIFLHKLCDDIPTVPQPAVVLVDEYDALADDIAGRLQDDLVETDHNIHTRLLPQLNLHTEPTVALPRLEAGNPLSWPLLYAGVGGYVRRGGDVSVHIKAACLGGPAAFAAQAAHSLLFAPLSTPLWASLGIMAEAAKACANGLEETIPDHQSREQEGPTALFLRLLGERDVALSHPDYKPTIVGPTPWVVLDLPKPTAPSATETTSLLNKLVASTPINAIEPLVPNDFLDSLTSVSTPDEFYALMMPLAERPASLVAILGVGWLYKVRYSYPLFRDLLHSHSDLHAVLESYGPHAAARNGLLMQSIEAAHVQGIFAHERLEA